MTEQGAGRAQGGWRAQDAQDPHAEYGPVRCLRTALRSLHDRITSVVRAWQQGRQRKMLPASGGVGPRAPLPSDAGCASRSLSLAGWPDALRSPACYRTPPTPDLLARLGRVRADWRGGGAAPADGRPRPPVPFARGARYKLRNTDMVTDGKQESRNISRNKYLRTYMRTYTRLTAGG